MKTRKDWMEAVASGRTTLGLIEFLRKADTTTEKTSVVALKEKPWKFGLAQAIKEHRSVRAGPFGKTVNKG